MRFMGMSKGKKSPEGPPEAGGIWYEAPPPMGLYWEDWAKALLMLALEELLAGTKPETEVTAASANKILLPNFMVENNVALMLIWRGKCGVVMMMMEGLQSDSINQLVGSGYSTT